jgi:VanZ family protein
VDPENLNQRRKLLVRGFGWCVCVGLWTAALLTITPVEVGDAVIPSGWHFPAAKSLHVCVYAFLTVYLSWLPLRRGRWFLLAFLSLHAMATEFLQQFVPGRTGTPLDVAIDHAGLLLGLALTWRHWRPAFGTRLQLSARSPQR